MIAPPPISAVSERDWTPQQREAINCLDGGVLVSAAAGSGKTAVLAERCAFLICDAKPPADVDQLLVVTFTESAAAEMKSRIHRALNERFLAQPSARLARQVALVEHAHVSTVHGFCNSVLRQNFNLAGLDPDFRILDGDEAYLLQLDVATEMFHQRYDSDESGDFHRLIDAYGDGDDQQLVQKIVATHNLLCSLVDPAGWISDVREDIEQATSEELESSNLGGKFILEVDAALQALERQCEEARAAVSAMGRVFGGYTGFLADMGKTLRHWQEVVREDGFDMLVGEYHDYFREMLRTPALASGVPGKDLAKALLDGVRDAMKGRALSDLLSSTSAELRGGMARVLPHAQVFLSLVTEFGKRYDHAKAAERALDFADLERRTLNVLVQTPGANSHAGNSASPQPSAIARAFHHQFRHVLVDEYQDINAIQDAILRLVSRECLVDGSSRPEIRVKSNLFCVGDVKQSIFRFRLAEPERFLKRQERLAAPEGKSIGRVVDLRENFRSRAPLLEAINAIFERLMTGGAVEIEYGQSHRLRAGREYPLPDHRPGFVGAPIELHLLPNNPHSEESAEDSNAEGSDLERTDYEAIFVARRIQKMMGMDGSPRMHVVKPDSSGTLVPTPIEYGDIVVLLRAMQFKADVFADVLSAHGIPVHSEGGAGFFNSPEIRDMLCLLQVLDNQQQDIPFAAVLRSPLSGIPDADNNLARIRLKYQAGEHLIPFHEAARSYALQQDDELAARLRDFFAELADWRDQANKRPVAELLWHLYDQTGFLAYCSGLPDGAQRAANLVELHQRAAQFGTFLRQGLYRFLRFLQTLKDQKDISRPSVAGRAEQVVRIMSIHRSKGQEFPVVVLPDLGKQHNLRDAEGAILVDRTAGLGMAVVDEARLLRYPSLASVLVKKSLLEHSLAEEVRLLYVAMTRAREHLILIGTRKEKTIEQWFTHWRNRDGALPAETVLGGRTMLDWLGPVAAMTESTTIPVFEVTRHTPADLSAWRHPRHLREQFSARQKAMADLTPLDPEPPANEQASQLIHRFQTPYPWRAYTNERASAPVTALAKGSTSDSSNEGVKEQFREIDPEFPSSPGTLGEGGVGAILHTSNASPSDDTAGFSFVPDRPQRKLDLPGFFVESAPSKATDIGTATHLVLQHWDFSQSAEISQLTAQIESLTSRKFISPNEARLVDLPAIQWLLGSDLGQLLKKHHAQLMREIPFAMAVPPLNPALPPSTDPMDQLMVRGRIDLLVPLDADQIAIVDYKTDNVSAQTVLERAQTYRLQMNLYRRAIEEIAHRTVANVYLVFLKPRIIQE